MARSADEEAVQGISDKKARKEAYYTRQRQNAKMGSAEKGKIEGKLNLGDEVRGFAKDQYQKVMAAGPWSIPGARTEEAAGAGVKALGKGVSSLAKRGEGAMENAVQTLKKPTPVKKAIGSSKPALTTVKQSVRGKAAADARRAAGKPDHWFQEKHQSPGAKAVGGKNQKALGTSGQGEWHAEVSKQASRKMPAQPKTFNRNGTKRAEGRQKSTRNPVSTRKAAGAHSDPKVEARYQNMQKRAETMWDAPKYAKKSKG
jgi:hypothetical protein